MYLFSATPAVECLFGGVGPHMHVYFGSTLKMRLIMLHTDVTESGLGVLKKQQYISPRGFPSLGQAVSMCENTIAIVS